jgi:hypothetical protein
MDHRKIRYRIRTPVGVVQALRESPSTEPSPAARAQNETPGFGPGAGVGSLDGAAPAVPWMDAARLRGSAVRLRRSHPRDSERQDPTGPTASRRGDGRARTSALPEIMRLLNSINNTPISECCDDRMNLRIGHQTAGEAASRHRHCAIRREGITRRSQGVEAGAHSGLVGPRRTTVGLGGWAAEIDQELQRSIPVGKVTVNPPARSAFGLRESVRVVTRRTCTRARGRNPWPEMITGLRRVSVRLLPGWLECCGAADASLRIPAPATVNPRVTASAAVRRRVVDEVSESFI